MAVRISFAVCLLALILAGCGSSAPTAGQTTDFASVCDKSNDGKRVAVEGYLRFPDSFTDSNSVVLRMYDKSDFQGTPIGVQTEFGTQANQVEPVKDQFQDTDLKVHQADGQVAQFMTRVRVSGKVYFPIVSQEFPCSLENPLVETIK